MSAVRLPDCRRPDVIPIIEFAGRQNSCVHVIPLAYQPSRKNPSDGGPRLPVEDAIANLLAAESDGVARVSPWATQWTRGTITA